VSSNASATRPLYSGELARLAGVSTDTLRYYERCHLLPVAPRSASGYRLFPPQALVRVRLIQGALAMGFSVKELAAIFGERDRGGAPCRRVRALAAERLVILEARLRDLRSWRHELRKTLAEWDRLLTDTPRGQRAGLLEAFVASHPTRQMRSSRPNALARGNQRREKWQ
jgi:DNA-binding transcriptional MerR regulator